MRARGKTIASKHGKLTSYDANHKPSIQIIKCIGFQKFRYCGEDRPGKKYQEKDFLQLSLHNLSGKNVTIQILCFDADNPENIHPNGLVGRDCNHGIYRKTIPVSKATQIIRIPYLRTERIRTKKNESDNLKKTLLERALQLPSPFKEKFTKQCEGNLKFDTTKVCFGVIATLEGVKMDPLFVVSNVVQNASEKTKLEIKKLSVKSVNAQEGGEIDIFTIEDGPPIMDGKCSVKVIVHQHGWESEETKPKREQIMYKRVVTYHVPPFKPNPSTTSPINAELKLSCLQSGQSCTFSFMYEPSVSQRDSDMLWSKPPRKRPYIVDDDDIQRLNGADNIKLRVKEKLQSRQSQADIDQMHDLHQRDTRSVPGTKGVIPVTVSQVLTKEHIQTVSGSKENQPQLQNDIIWATDAITGELVYLRTTTGGSVENVVVYVEEGEKNIEGVGSLVGLPGVPELSAPKAVAVPDSEWSTSVSQSSGTLRTLAPLNTARSVMDVRMHESSPGVASKARRKSILSPWLVGEPEVSPLMHGDVALNPLPDRHPAGNFVVPSTVAAALKQESVEFGTLSGGVRNIDPVNSVILISNETVPDVGNSLPSLPLSSFLTSGGLESNLKGMKFDDSGTLLSSSVFEMVEPYLNK
ncbi:hypothetical protein C0Q70_13402 [Pomacea canaliculata]|uniref:RHD domain-containing protein n=1 Tax=Pomacea canaliculata TaxID=400727 RepID=A0A2T7NX60_POMCA|nr:hypothetical protein C0Q70_13402 [Pomacea canaliculata]